jgi:hypothetical protein
MHHLLNAAADIVTIVTGVVTLSWLLWRVSRAGRKQQ